MEGWFGSIRGVTCCSGRIGTHWRRSRNARDQQSLGLGGNRNGHYLCIIELYRDTYYLSWFFLDNKVLSPRNACQLYLHRDTLFLSLPVSLLGLLWQCDPLLVWINHALKQNLRQCTGLQRRKMDLCTYATAKRRTHVKAAEQSIIRAYLCKRGEEKCARLCLAE